MLCKIRPTGPLITYWRQVSATRKRWLFTGTLTTQRQTDVHLRYVGGGCGGERGGEGPASAAATSTTLRCLLLFYFHSPPVTGSECCAASLGELFPVNGVIVFCARWCLCLWVSWVSLPLSLSLSKQSLDVFQSSAPVAFCVNNSCARPRRSAEPLLVTRSQLISYVNVSLAVLLFHFVTYTQILTTRSFCVKSFNVLSWIHIQIKLHDLSTYLHTLKTKWICLSIPICKLVGSWCRSCKH